MKLVRPTIRKPVAPTHALRRRLEGLEARDVPSGFTFADFSNANGINLVGAAAFTSTNRLRLTPAQDSAGGAWYVADKTLVAGGFETTFRFQLATTTGGSDTSDGFAFLIQNNGPAELRGGGGTLGYNGVPNSVAVEFDTWLNSEYNDPSQSHISVHTNGTGPNRPHESYSLEAYNTSGFILDNAQVHTAKVRYVPGALSVFLDNLTTPVLTVSVDLSATLSLDDGQAWLGFTACGRAPANQDILDWSAQSTDDVILADRPVLVEGSGNTTTTANFTITRVGTLAGQAVVNWSTVNGTATAGTDYVAASGQVAFAEGESQTTVAVTVLGDETPELDEIFKLLLFTTTGYSTASGLATIRNDDTVLSVEDVVAAEGDGRIGRSLGAFVSQADNGGFDRARGIAWGPDENLYVGSYYTNQILQFDGATGAFRGTFIDHVDSPAVQGLVFRPDGLYVLSRDAATVHRYDAATGASLGTFISTGSGGLTVAKGMTVGPDGKWYVSSGTNEILRYSPTGAFLGAFVSAGSGGLNAPRGLTFGPDGNLYVASENSHSVLRYNGQTGAFISAFVPLGSGGLLNPGEVLFHSGSLYVSSQHSNEVLCYNAQTGVFVDKAASTGLGGLDQPLGLLFDSNNNLLVGGASEIHRFGPLSLAAFTVGLNYASANPVTVNYSVTSGTSAAGSDFIPVSGTLTFAPGQTVQTVIVQTLDDALTEGTETFTLNLSNPIGAAITDDRGEATITDNDTTKFFVVDDASTNQTYRYGAPGNSNGNTALAGGNTAPRGAASTAAGTTLWVVDTNKTVYVYSASGGPLGSWAAGGLNASAQVEGIATNGTDVWLLDNKQDKVFKYTGAASRRTGSQNAAGSFNLNNANGNAKGIVTDGTSLWVVDDGSANKVFKYTLGGSFLGGWAIDAANTSPTGLTIDPANVSDIWVVDNATDKVYQYTAAAGRISGSQSSSATFALAIGNTNPQDIADPPVAPPPGLVSWWPGDGDTTDLAGPNNGVLANGAGHHHGYVADSFHFDGQDDVFQAPATGLPTGSADRTLMLWVRIEPQTSGSSFFASYGIPGTGQQVFSLGRHGDRRLYNSNWGADIVGPVLEDERWYFVAARSVGTTCTLYLDGVPVASGTMPLNTPSGSSFWIGRQAGSFGDTRRLDGAVDEVAVFNRALSDAEIFSIYQAGHDGMLKPYLVVNSSMPGEGEALMTSPTAFTIDFNHALVPATVQTGDFTVNGIAASSFTMVDADTVQFQYANSPVTAASAQTMVMAAGTVQASGTVAQPALRAWSKTFTYAPAVQVQSAQVNDGSAQRSRVTSLSITFNTQVTFATTPTAAFALTRNSDGAVVTFAANANVVGGVTVVTLTKFGGAATQSGSLADGRYTLTALASQISANGQQMAANYTFGDAQGLFRFYGDMNGDRRVDISDFGFFSLAYLQTANYNAALDFNNDGRIDIADFGQFSVRFFTTLP